MNNLTELSKKVYQLQIEKGWCKPDEKRDIEDLKILILSEAFEAFEAYRKRDHSPSTSNLAFIQSQIKSWSRSENIVFRDEIKDTFEDEIADVAIRALDLAGYLELDFEGATMDSVLTFGFGRDKENFPMYLDMIKNYITNYDRCFTEQIGISWVDYNNSTQPVTNSFILNILSWCKTMAELNDFDLMQHIELKLAYNKTRPFRHGGKVV